MTGQGALSVVCDDVFAADLPVGQARLVYADPPYTRKDYFGYGVAPDWRQLVERMLELAAEDAVLVIQVGSGNLHELLPIVEELAPRRRIRSGTGNRARTLAWVKPWGAWRPNTTFQYSWEPIVVFYGLRYRHPRMALTGAEADWFCCPPVRADDVGHPTPKPPQLLHWLFDRLLTDARGRLAIDLFAGSGQAAIAACRYGLDAIAVERHPAYADLIRARAGDQLGGRTTPLEAAGIQQQIDGLDGGRLVNVGSRPRPPHYERRRSHLSASLRRRREAGA